MKTIKIFLASSEELKEERTIITEFVAELNSHFKSRGLCLEVERWEWLDSSMGKDRKQDEYNNILKTCEMCLTLFWHRFGCYTEEEFSIAANQAKMGQNPQKVYVFFKNMDDGTPISDELLRFKEKLVEKYNHFHDVFTTPDSLKLKFLLQLEIYQKNIIGDRTIDIFNGQICIDNHAIVDMNNIPFILNNEGYQKKKNELGDLNVEIENKQEELKKKEEKLNRKEERLAQNPDDEDLKEDIEEILETIERINVELQQKIDKRNKLQDELEKDQQNLLDTARHITQLKGEQISARMQRAIDAFESGDVQRADIILKEAERDAEQIFNDIQILKSTGKESVEELILKANVKMSNNNIDIDERIEQTNNIYLLAIKIAKEIGYEKERLAELIDKYGSFLLEYGEYEQALQYRMELVSLLNDSNDDNVLASAYNKMGNALMDNSLYEDALDSFQKAITITERLASPDPILVAEIYNSIGNYYLVTKQYDKSMDFHQKALKIRINVLGENHYDVAQSYNNIGNVLFRLDNNKEALEYHFKALKTKENILGENHRSIAISSKNIGNIFLDLKSYREAYQFYNRALKIFNNSLGTLHSDTCNVINCIFEIWDLGIKLEECQDEIIEWVSKCTTYAKKGYWSAQRNLGVLYENGHGVVQDYAKAAEWYTKAALQGYSFAQCNLGVLHENGRGVKQDYYKAIEWYTRAAEQGDSIAQYNLGFTIRS